MMKNAMKTSDIDTYIVLFNKYLTYFCRQNFTLNLH